MKKFYVALLCFFIAGALRAQGPGGVSANLSLWLKPDGLAAGTLNTWNYSNNANSFTAGPTAPTVVANIFNFWPAVNFSGGTQSYMTGPSGPGGAPITAGQTAYAIFAVWSSPTAVGGANMRVWSQRESAGGSNFDGASLFVYPAAGTQAVPYNTSGPTYGDQPEEGPSFTTGVAYPTSTATIPYQWSTGTTGVAVAQSILTYAPNKAYISSLNLLNAPTNDLELMDETNYGPTPAVTSTDPNANANGGNRVITDQLNILGARTTASGDENFSGNLAELIVYNTNVTATQRQQIFSYLSLKYGIPLGGSYFSSGGGTIWDATVLGGAYNN
ncbi:MAG TPA: hypothetical protein VHW43_08395, partial [Puia sp.]|nr:hypothetical protein [Puia sp.]